MLNLARGIRVFLATTPFDMRGSYDAMAGRARRLGLEPVDGAYYVFLSKSRKQLAVIHYDGSGWCTFRKRLDLGTFELPPVPDGVAHLAVDLPEADHRRGAAVALPAVSPDLRRPRLARHA